MPAAFNPDVQETNQTQGSHPSHTGTGSRFGPEDVRGPVVLGANVIEAVAEFKRGTFTVEDLRQLAFAMGCQIVDGTNTAALAGQIEDLKTQLANAQHRAGMAEGAYKGKNDLTDESLAALASNAGFELVSKADISAMASNVTSLTTRATTAEAALATAQSDLSAMTTRATTAEAALANVSAPEAQNS